MDGDAVERDGIMSRDLCYKTCVVYTVSSSRLTKGSMNSTQHHRISLHS
jgi:hypothetical protein